MTTPKKKFYKSTERLYELVQLMEPGKEYRAMDIAAHLGCVTNTVHNRIERLVQAGAPIVAGEFYDGGPGRPQTTYTLTEEWVKR